MYRIETNFNDFVNNQLKTFEQLRSADKVLRTAALNTTVLISDRVQQKGLKTDGTPIGGGKGYSTKSLKFKAITGKFSDIANKKQKKKHKGDSFDGGYKEFREKLGFQTDHIDLTLTGDMMGDFIAEPAGETSYEVGFRGDESSKKAEWHEERFGTVFQLSPNELLQVRTIIDKDISAIIG